VQFSGEPVYREDAAPDAAEVAARVQAYWRPYHDTLDAELARIRGEHGRAVLWEGHAIRGTLPFQFDGALPELNLGTAAGASCRPELQQHLAAVLAGQGDYTHVVNGRFKGGYITRHYGAPEIGVDAVQLEIAQHAYMDEDSFEYLPEKATKLQAVIGRLLEAALA
jgi:N-formylglutamate deformylase